MNCSVCGNSHFVQHAVLWPELINAWGLSRDETNLIEEQQGLACTKCNSNLRVRTLASAIMDHFNFGETFEAFSTAFADRLKILEVNAAGQLSYYLQRMPGHTLVNYPEVDMQNMFAIGALSCDLVLHSDTLEHVPDPVAALRECRRVLKPSGILAYTIPIIAGRLTRKRDGLPPSYHGNPEQSGEDFRVVSEYGANFWTEVFDAGFSKINLFAIKAPQSIGIIAVK